MTKKILLKDANVPGIKSFDVYRRQGGYSSVEKALKMKPEEIVDEVKKERPSGPWRRRLPYWFKMEFYSKASRCTTASGG